MPFTVCCMSSCNMTKYDVRLFVFPRNDYLRSLWLSRVAPHCPNLTELSKEQLMCRKVCIRHFEKKFLQGNQRKYNACPTLMTAEEISSGIPNNPIILPGESDHTYKLPTRIRLEHSYNKIALTDLTKMPNLKASETLGNTSEELPSHSTFVEPLLSCTVPNMEQLAIGLKTDHNPVSDDHGHSSSRPSGTVDKNNENLNSVDIELNSAVSHNVDIELDAEIPHNLDIESDAAGVQITDAESEVPDATGPFTWQKHSEVILSDDEDDEEVYKRSETEADNVLNEKNKRLTTHTSEFDIRSEGELELQCDGNEEDAQSHSQHYKCNVCGSLIHGFRYRCVQCADYDLCAACEARGVHELHYVLRIPGPRPYAEIENVLNRIRKELLDMNNTVLLEDTDMLDSLKEEVKDEMEDPLHESQSTENNHMVAANNLDEVHNDDQLSSDTDVQSIAEEDRRQENDNVAFENDDTTQDNDNVTQANVVTREVGKENNNTHISTSIPTESNVKVIDTASLKRKMNESPTKLSDINISNIQQHLDSKKIRILSVPIKQLLDTNVSNVQRGLSSNKTRLLPASGRKLPSNVSSVQPHLDSNQISLSPVSAKQLPDNISSTQQHLDSNKTSILSASTKHLPAHFRTRPKKSVVLLKTSQRSSASNPSNIINLSTPLLIRQPLNVITETNRHLFAEQLFGDKVPQVHLESLATEEIDVPQRFS